MSRWWISFLLLALVILNSGCAKGGLFADSAPLDVYVDYSVTDEEYNLLAQDFDLLKKVQFTELRDDNYRGILGISEMTPEALRGWLGARIHIIVGDSFGGYESSGDSNLVTNAYNYGASKYLDANGSTTSVTLGDGRVIDITTPRVGLIKKGPGYFEIKSAGSAKNSVFHGLRRLAILAHEGRHDDGHGSDTALSHAECPYTSNISSSYRGQSVCENYLNGPYRVSVATLKHFRQFCTRYCTTTELNQFDAIITDYAGRLLPTARYVDPRPEGS